MTKTAKLPQVHGSGLLPFPSDQNAQAVLLATLRTLTAIRALDSHSGRTKAGRLMVPPTD